MAGPVLHASRRAHTGNKGADFATVLRILIAERRDQHRILDTNPVGIGRKGCGDRGGENGGATGRQCNSIQAEERSQIARMAHEPIRPHSRNRVIFVD